MTPQTASPADLSEALAIGTAPATALAAGRVGQPCSCGRPIQVETGLCCAPRFGTPRVWARTSYGSRAAAAAAQLGKPYTPWQRHVVDVALEVDPDTGLLVYREVVLVVPRQSGKTTIVISVSTHRAIGFDEPQVIVYTAQTRNDARAKWEDEHVETLKKSSFRRLFTVGLTNGREAIKWKNPRSRWGLTAATNKSGHGGTIDLGWVDEAFAQVDDRQEQAMRPAMITRPQPQQWILSAAGKPETSHYLWGKIEKGRARELARAATGQEPRGAAYFEWSADDDADADDPATWWACMPALGHTITEEAVGAEREGMGDNAFRRAFLSQWRAEDEAPDWVIPRTHWASCADPGDALDPEADPGMQLTGNLALALDGAPFPSHMFALTLAGATASGHEGIEVVDHGDGSEWVVPRVVDLLERQAIQAVALDPTGPAGALLADLQAAGIEVVTTGSRDMSQACGQVYNSALAHELRHRGQAALTDALAGAAKRDLGDAWAWSRRRSDVDICPLVSGSLALWVYRAQVRGRRHGNDVLSRIW